MECTVKCTGASVKDCTDVVSGEERASVGVLPWLWEDAEGLGMACPEYGTHLPCCCPSRGLLHGEYTPLLLGT